MMTLPAIVDMDVLDLKFDPPINRAFERNALNLLFTFQVNCPGCFIYGFPLMNQLSETINDNRLSLLGLSTAFEDFDLNTAANTRALIERGEVVGETRKMLDNQGLNRYPVPINFPVAMDAQVSEAEVNSLVFIEKICRINPEYDSWPKNTQKLLQQKVRAYLAQHKRISHTFTLNQFRGTPTLIVFDREGKILHHWFGHVAPDLVIDSLKAALKH